MKVLKFGGTSVGSAERIKTVADIATKKGKNIVVLSAMAGTTNALVEISDSLRANDTDKALAAIAGLERQYARTISSLYTDARFKTEAAARVSACFNLIKASATEMFTPGIEKTILAQGEIMSSNMMDIYLHEQGRQSVLLPALEYMRIDANDDPEPEYIKMRLSELIGKHPDAELYITQGYICLNANGRIDNLQRGGSDYSASLVGEAIGAEEIEIWTDIDGMHNNDPRYVEGTKPVAQLSFEEAEELARFGAKILHPACILPAKRNGIPVRLLNTLNPASEGTLINRLSDGAPIKAISAKDNVAVICVEADRHALTSHSFMRRVTEVFEAKRANIDMISGSDFCVSVTTDDNGKILDIAHALRNFGAVSIESGLSVVSIVGKLAWDGKGYGARAAAALSGMSVRMISYGGHHNSATFLISTKNKVEALNKLNKALF